MIAEPLLQIERRLVSTPFCYWEWFLDSTGRRDRVLPIDQAVATHVECRCLRLAGFLNLMPVSHACERSADRYSGVGAVCSKAR